MLRPLYIVNRLALLMLGMALAVAAQAQPAPGAPQAPAAKVPSKAAPAHAAQAPAKTPAKAPAKAQVKAPAKAQAKPPAKKPAPPKPAVTHHEPKKRAEKPAEAEKKKEVEVSAPKAEHRRDPFLALIAGGGHGPIVLPPGKAGLQVSTLRVEGIVRSQNGMIVVVLNPQGRTYFLHQGDRLFDGRVEQISMDAVTFQESGKDPFGNNIERTVVKRVYPSAGEQQ
jgi:type IV secretory pathway VirB10-like protein